MSCQLIDSFDKTIGTALVEHFAAALFASADTDNDKNITLLEFTALNRRALARGEVSMRPPPRVGLRGCRCRATGSRVCYPDCEGCRLQIVTLEPACAPRCISPQCPLTPCLCVDYLHSNVGAKSPP